MCLGRGLRRDDDGDFRFSIAGFSIHCRACCVAPRWLLRLRRNRESRNRESKAPMTESEFKGRTKEFAHRAVRLAESLPATRTARIIADQLTRSATSVAANYRSACRSRSVADFRNKLAIA